MLTMFSNRMRLQLTLKRHQVARQVGADGGERSKVRWKRRVWVMMWTNGYWCVCRLGQRTEGTVGKDARRTCPSSCVSISPVHWKLAKSKVRRQGFHWEIHPSLVSRFPRCCLRCCYHFIGLPARTSSRWKIKSIPLWSLWWKASLVVPGWLDKVPQDQHRKRAPRACIDRYGFSH